MAEPLPAGSSGSTPHTDRFSTPAADRQEQRLHPRFKVEGGTAVLGKPGILSYVGIGPEKHPVVNLSQGGLMVMIRKPLPVGGRMSLRIEIPRVRETIQGQGEIRWCAQGAKSQKEYYAGISFVAIPAAERQKIARMQELFTSQEYRAKAVARKEASSSHFKAVKF